VATVALNGEETPSGSRSVVDRTLLILSCFHSDRERLALSDISRITGLPIATCFRIIQRLVEWGALERDAANRYRIGLRLWEVASLAPRSTGLQRIARPYLLEFYEKTGYVTHLAIREGTELVSIERFQDPRPHARTDRPLTGRRYELHASAIGQVLLAYAPQYIRDRVLASPLTVFTPNTMVDRPTLVRVLDDIRRCGYAVTDRQVDLQHVSVAAPVRDAGGSVIAAVSLARKAEDADQRNMIRLARLAAAAISKALAAAETDRRAV